jgi:N-acetyl-anhydromuramyl-L-alanine amidase AmpD
MINLSDIPFIQAKSFRKGRLRPVQLIVLHSEEAPKTEGRARNVAHFFQSAPASAHYCVDDKEVIQCVKLEDTAFQCKNANANGVGIEHSGFARQSAQEWQDDYSKAMFDLSTDLAAQLCHKFGIPAQAATFASPQNPSVVQPGFVMHKDVPLHGSHTDPGLHFPFAAYIAQVHQKLQSLNAEPDDVAAAPSN